MNKKGTEMLTMSLIIIMILGIITLIFGINVQKKLSDASGEFAKDSICTETLRLESDKRVPILEVQYSENYKCPTKYITIFEDRVEKEYDDFTPEDSSIVQKFGEDCTGHKSFSNYKRCVLSNSNKFIAKELVSCWDKFHKGTISLFSQYTDERQCLVCSVIYFDSPIQDRIGGDYVGWQFDHEPEISLDAYLRQNSPIQGYTGKGQTDSEGKVSAGKKKSYYEYTLDLLDKYVEQPYYDYDPQYDYAIVLTALNKNRLKSLGDRIINLALGTKDPRGEFINTMTFIENDQVTTICDTIV